VLSPGTGRRPRGALALRVERMLGPDGRLPLGGRRPLLSSRVRPRPRHPAAPARAAGCGGARLRPHPGTRRDALCLGRPDGTSLRVGSRLFGAPGRRRRRRPGLAPGSRHRPRGAFPVCVGLRPGSRARRDPNGEGVVPDRPRRRPAHRHRRPRSRRRQPRRDPERDHAAPRGPAAPRSGTRTRGPTRRLPRAPESGATRGEARRRRGRSPRGWPCRPARAGSSGPRREGRRPLPRQGAAR